MNELCHHGIKGQKWGVRRYQNEDGTLTAAGKNRYNEDYTTTQRLRDEAIYGRGGVKRINRSMNEGYGVQGSRSLEARRIDKARDRASAAGSVGSVGGKVAGFGIATVGYPLLKTALRNSSNKTIREVANTLDTNTYADMTARAMLTTGAIRVGGQVGRTVGRSGAMAVSGYSPDLYR